MREEGRMPFKDRDNYPHRRWRWVLVVIAAVIVILSGLSYVISNETLRRYMEHQVNTNLKGYKVHIGQAYFHPLALALNLHDLTLTQDARPNPPVADVRRLHASVHWGALLNARLVGDLLIDRPKLYINLKNIEKEEESEIPLKEKGWQQALESISPLKINIFRINDGGTDLCG